MLKFLLLISSLVLFECHLVSQSVTDVDGNVYPTITFGSQTWMRSNLEVRKFNNLDPIPTTPLGENISDETDPVYQWRYNNHIDNVYGLLYTWHTVMDERNLCPQGWRVPTSEDWLSLAAYLGDHGHGFNGNEIWIAKSMASTKYWTRDSVDRHPGHNPSVNNSSGFNATPGGLRNGQYHNFTSIFRGSFWWTASDSNIPSEAKYHSVLFNQPNFRSGTTHKNAGLSVRCIKGLVSSTFDSSNEKKLLLFPNPAVLSFFIENNHIENLDMEILSLDGKIITKHSLCTGKNQIDISHLAGGLYLIHVTGSNWHWHEKLIVQ